MVNPHPLHVTDTSPEKTSISPAHSGHFLTFNVGVPRTLAAPGHLLSSILLLLYSKSFFLKAIQEAFLILHRTSSLSLHVGFCHEHPSSLWQENTGHQKSTSPLPYQNLRVSRHQSPFLSCLQDKQQHH